MCLITTYLFITLTEIHRLPIICPVHCQCAKQSIEYKNMGSLIPRPCSLEKKRYIRVTYFIIIIIITQCCEGEVQDTVGELAEEPRAVETQETFVTIDDGTRVLMLVLFSSTFSISISERVQQEKRTMNQLKNPRTCVLVTTWFTLNKALQIGCEVSGGLFQH